MTVRELINALEEVVRDYGEDCEDKEVIIAEYQNYGSDFAYSVDFVDIGTYSNWDGTIPNNDDEDNYDEDDDESNCVRIVLGRQIGTMQDDLW